MWADPRALISQAYSRSSRAMGLKFIDGVYSVRGANFKLEDPDGVQVSLDIERNRLEQLLGPALKVEEQSQILKFRMEGNVAHCTVGYFTRIYGLKDAILRYDTDCEDQWVQVGEDWKLIHTRVIRQKVNREQP